jgi:hypothetical protein
MRGQRQAMPAQPPGAQQPGQLPAPILEVKALMGLFNRPLFVSLKEKMAQPAANDRQWEDLANLGMQGAEIANLVAIRNVQQGREAWLQGAGNLQRAGLALAEAAKTKQWNAAQQAYMGVIQSCNACHQARAPETAPQIRP